MKKVIIIIALIELAISGWLVYHYPHKNSTRVAQSVQVDYSNCTFSDQELLDKINSYRTNKLTVDSYLDNLAQERSDTMPTGLDNHVGFRQLNNRLLGYQHVGEVLASVTKCPMSVFEQWRNSPSHWSAITNERYDVLGIGFNGQSAVVIFGDK